MFPGRAPSPPPLAAATGNLPISVLLNANSGSKDKSAVRTAIDTVLSAAGRDVELSVARHPRDLSKLARQAADNRPGILVATGGDGTLNAVAFETVPDALQVIVPGPEAAG